jgi:predicted porin
MKMNTIKLTSIILSLVLAITSSFVVNAGNKMAETANIHKQLEVLQRRLAELENINIQEQETKEHSNVTFYGSFRPSLTFSDFGNGQTSADVTDFFSRIGFKGDIKINNKITAFYQGEWDIDIEADADFGDARLGFVGIQGDFGQVALGKQYNPHYIAVGAVTDIFNNRASPFAYDEAGPARTNQMVTYSYSNQGLQIDAGLQFNGDAENSAGGDNTQANAVKHVDSGSIGIGYTFGDIYVGASYLDQQLNKNDERDFHSFAASWKISNDIYFATTYRDIELSINNITYEQSSLDIATSISLIKGYTLKAAYFDWDGDGQGRKFDGYNLTIENQLNDSVRIFVEWLSRNIEKGEAQKHLSIGIRYDFESLL